MGKTKPVLGGIEGGEHQRPFPHTGRAKDEITGIGCSEDAAFADFLTWLYDVCFVFRESGHLKTINSCQPG